MAAFEWTPTVALGLLMLMVAGCEPSPEKQKEACDKAASAQQELRIGIGVTDFSAVADGDELPITFGPQGGAHIDIALRASGIVPEMDPAVDLMLYAMTDDDEIVAGQGRSFLPFDGDASDSELLGARLFLEAPAYDHDGDFVVSVSVLDTCGTELTAERVVTLE